MNCCKGVSNRDSGVGETPIAFSTTSTGLDSASCGVAVVLAIQNLQDGSESLALDAGVDRQMTLLKIQNMEMFPWE